MEQLLHTRMPHLFLSATRRACALTRTRPRETFTVVPTFFGNPTARALARARVRGALCRQKRALYTSGPLATAHYTLDTLLVLTTSTAQQGGASCDAFSHNTSHTFTHTMVLAFGAGHAGHAAKNAPKLYMRAHTL